MCYNLKQLYHFLTPSMVIFTYCDLKDDLVQIYNILNLYEVPYIVYLLFSIFIFEKFPELTQLFRSKIYGLSKDVSYPKPFKTFTFSWDFTNNSKNSNLTRNNRLLELRFARFIKLSKMFKLLRKGGSASKTLLSDKRFYYLHFSNLSYRRLVFNINYLYNTVVNDGLLYIKGLLTLCIIDALIADDEPLCEPVE